MKFQITITLIAVYALLTGATASFSHVVLQHQAALANTNYRATLRVGHGCGGLQGEAGPMWFKVLQTCEKGSIDWAEVPVSGTSTKGLKAPAALLEIIPSDHAGHAH